MQSKDSPKMDSKEDKIIKYESFINEKLRPDLRKALDARESVYESISKYLQLRNVIEGIKASQLDEEPLKTKVDLGNNFYAKAKVEDPSKICVAVGFGLFLEMTHDEALRFIEKKSKHLEEKSTQISDSVNSIKATIKFVLEGLRELQNISGESDPKPYRDVL